MPSTTQIKWKCTSATAVVIFVPPEPPTTILTLLFLSSRMAGHIEDMGLLSEQRREATS